MISPQYTQEILADTEVEETQSIENLDGYLSDEDINKIWSEHMHDFVPEDMTNAIVEARSTEALFAQIDHATPTTVKGAFYVLNGNKDKTLDCVIYDPERSILYKQKGSAQGIFVFDTTIPGEYALIFSNSKGKEDLTVTLALHTYEDKEEEIQYDIKFDGTRVVKDSNASPEDSSTTNVSELDAEALLGGADNLAATEDEMKSVK